jgi:glycosyltransferase involved in cell wall biosynthesis
MDLTLLVPCFNEAKRIDACLAAVCSYADGLDGTSVEVLVVDDGSADGTADRVRAHAAARAGGSGRADVRLLALERNAGKGEAVRRGVLEARGDVVVFLDADLAVDVGHVDRVLPALQDGVDVAVGCRNVPGARVTRRQAGVRRALGRGYLNLARLLLGLRVSDVTCGFKGFRRAVAVELFRDARCRRWGFDAEILHLAARDRYVVREVPVEWRDGAGSKVRLPGDVLRSLKELVAVRWRSATGAYGPPVPRGDRGPR